jgi:hypothetical protein
MRDAAGRRGPIAHLHRQARSSPLLLGGREQDGEQRRPGSLL